jgi:ADP-ribose pyrophosphatase
MRKIIPKNARLIPPQAKRVFKGIMFDVYQWPQTMFDGSVETFEMLKRPDTTKVLAVRNDKLVILEEEQPGRSPFIGLPGGIHDHQNEDEFAAIKRELAEEAGLTFKTWKLIQVKQLQPKIDHFVYLFLATDFEKEVPRHLDAGEKITVTYRTLEEVKELSHADNARPLANEILSQLSSLDDLLELPEYQP